MWNVTETPLPVSSFHEAEQVLEVPGKPIYGMDVQGVPLPDVLQAGGKLWPLYIRRTGLVLEHPVQLHPRELPVRLLVQAAHPDVSHVRHDLLLVSDWIAIRCIRS